jgi:3-hydroxyisobutyrate dehydrogenase-like beta-hydroxyacid dehydrogenase
MATVAVLGTGLLGSGMAQSLLGKGQGVRAWNRSPQKLQPLVQLGAVAARDPADAVRGAERVHLILAADDAVDSVVDALRPGLGDGVPVIDHSTNLPARVATRFAKLRSQGVRYLPAPVFMSPQNAREGSGLMLVSGPRDDFDRLQPALALMTGKAAWVGERPDLAAIHKLSGNGLLLSLCGVLGDLLAMGAAAGVDSSTMLSLFELWKPGAAIPLFGQRVAAAGDGPASFELQMARKDVRLMLETAGTAPLTVLPGVAAAMDRALQEGRGAQDFAVFARADRGAAGAAGTSERR